LKRVFELAGRAAVAWRILVCEYPASVSVKPFVRFEFFLRDFVSVSPHGKASELQLVGVVKAEFRAEVVFAALVGEVSFVCVHFFNLSEIE
jgi:hypothetical protein